MWLSLASTPRIVTVLYVILRYAMEESTMFSFIIASVNLAYGECSISRVSYLFPEHLHSSRFISAIRNHQASAIVSAVATRRGLNFQDLNM